MIEDTLKANPGMLETYREYARLMHGEATIKRLSAELDSCRAAGADEEVISDLEERLTRVRAKMKETHAAAFRSLRREDELRAELGMPPLDQKIVKSAHESLKQYEEFFQEQEAATAAV